MRTGLAEVKGKDVTEKQLIGKFLALDSERGPFTQDEWDAMKKEKAEIIKQLLESPDESVQAIAIRFQLDHHAHNARLMIADWLATQ